MWEICNMENMKEYEKICGKYEVCQEDFFICQQKENEYESQKKLTLLLWESKGKTVQVPATDM